MALHYLPSLALSQFESVAVGRGHELRARDAAATPAKPMGQPLTSFWRFAPPSLPSAQIVHCEFATGIAIAESLFSFSSIRYSIDSAVVILVQGNFLLSCSWYSGIALWPISNSGMLVKNPPSPGPRPRPLLFPPSYGQNKDGFPCFFAGPRCH